MGYALTSKSQVTIPKHIRDVLGVGPGDQVNFLASELGVVTVVPDERPKETFLERVNRVRGTADAGLRVEEIMEMSRGEVQVDAHSSDYN
jgi:antitoxin PrlF